MSKPTHLRTLFEEIEQKRRLTVDNPDLPLVSAKASMKVLSKEAKLTRLDELQTLAHSARIEHPLAHLKDLPKKAQRHYRKELGRIAKRLEDAWITAKVIFPEDGELNQGFLTTIASKIEPEVVYGIRREAVIYGNQAPPDPEYIERELNMAFYENRALESPLEKALHAHLHIVRVHPFIDGNGRTARMVQNVLLTKSTYPSVLIEEAERHLYFDLLGAAIEGYSERRDKGPQLTEAEELFYEFLGSKVNLAYDTLLKRE